MICACNSSRGSYRGDGSNVCCSSNNNVIAGDGKDRIRVSSSIIGGRDSFIGSREVMVVVVVVVYLVAVVVVEALVVVVVVL